MVAFMATAILIFLSCDWLRTKKKESSNPLVGEWKLDSVRIGKDTTATFFLAIVHDSGTVNISFTKDTVFTQSNHHTDTAGYSFDKKSNRMVMEDSSETLIFSRLNDSLVSLTAADSTTLFLKKK